MSKDTNDLPSLPDTPVPSASDAEPPSAVFTPEQVVRLWQHQFGPWRNPWDLSPESRDKPLRMHPFTCGNRKGHPTIGGDHGILIPTVRGWICQFCDYTQKWAHDSMMAPRPARRDAPQDTPPAASPEGAGRAGHGSGQ